MAGLAGCAKHLGGVGLERKTPPAIGGGTITTCRGLVRSRGDYAATFAIPSFFIRDRRVLGLMPAGRRRRRARGSARRSRRAPDGCACARFPRGSRCRLARDHRPGGGLARGLATWSSSRISTTGPGLKTQARSSTFCSSRMFPGQAYRSSRSMLSGVTPLSGLASLRWNCARKCLTSSGMSLGRSRKRRHPDREHVEPVEQVGPEPLRGHLLLQVAVGRRHQPHVDPLRVVARRPARTPAPAARAAA